MSRDFPALGRLLRLVPAAALALALGTAGVAAASTQDAYRDRGERYERARAGQDLSRSRTRAQDNTRFERPSADFVRRSEPVQRGDYRRSSYNESYRNNYNHFRGSYRDYDRSNYRGYERGHNDYVKRSYEPRSRFSLSLSAYSRPYTLPAYDYVPSYRRELTHYSPYSYRPAYHYGGHFEPYRPVYSSYTTYYHRPVTRVVYSSYDYCPPPFVSYGVRYHSYPRHSYPRSGLSFGIRYDYRR